MPEGGWCGQSTRMLEHRLKQAHDSAMTLLRLADKRGVIAPGQTEQQVSERLHVLAEEIDGQVRYWHKRVVRAGPNTLQPYREWPPDRVIEEDDILFVDLGPVFSGAEADIGRTYVLGGDGRKLKLQADVEAAWHEGRAYFLKKYSSITGAQLFQYAVELAKRMGWSYGGPHAGHLVGDFPHERLLGNALDNYIHPENDTKMSAPDKHGAPRQWVFEIHFVDREAQIGAFFEQWVGVD